METNVRTNSERETLARLDELVFTSLSPPNHSLYTTPNSYHYNDKDEEVEMDEVNDEIFSLPQFSRFKNVTADHGDPSVNSLASPLSAHYVDDENEHKDILHDFNNRDKKIQELILFNKQDFEMIKQKFNCSEEEWKRFLRVLYAKSEIVPDREWFNTICEFINPTNPLLSKFKELISNNLQAETTNDDEVLIDLYGAAPSQNSEIDDDGYSPSYNSTTSSRRESKEDIMDFRDVDIKVIRNYPEKLADFEIAYPDFFMNARIYFGQECRTTRLGNHLHENIGNTYNLEFTNGGDSTDSITDYGGSCLNGDYNEDFVEGLRANVEEHGQACEDSELYDHFVQILLAPRRMMPDDLWEEAIYECLSSWPHLMVQLKDIIAYEVSNENINGEFSDSYEIIQLE